MSSMASQITSLKIVYSTIDSDADQRKHQSSASLAFVRGIHRWPVNSPHKWPCNAGNVSIWWRHHGLNIARVILPGGGCQGIATLILLTTKSVNPLPESMMVSCWWGSWGTKFIAILIKISHSAKLKLDLKNVRRIPTILLPSQCRDDVIKWKHFPRYWSFVRGIHRSPVDSPHKGQCFQEFSCFPWSVPEITIEQTIETLVIWDPIALIMTSLCCVKSPSICLGSN